MPEPQKITVSFRKSPDYRIYPATGAWGGATPDGHILMNIIVEHATLPSYQTFAVQEGGRIDHTQPLDSVATGDGERDVLCGIMFSVSTARAVAQWLNNHADKLEQGGR